MKNATAIIDNIGTLTITHDCGHTQQALRCGQGYGSDAFYCQNCDKSMDYIILGQELANVRIIRTGRVKPAFT
jgi:hypothetical protein